MATTALALAVTGCSSGSGQAGATAGGTSTSASSTTASPSTTTPATTTTSTPAASKAPGEGFAFRETATVLNKGAPAAEITVGRPVEFTSTNPYSTPAHERFVYVPVTVKATGSVTLPVEDFRFQVLLPNGDYDSPLYIAGRPAEAPPDIDEASVKPGDTLVGSVTFDVPKDVELKIAYEPALKDLAVWF